LPWLFPLLSSLYSEESWKDHIGKDEFIDHTGDCGRLRYSEGFNQNKSRHGTAWSRAAKAITVGAVHALDVRQEMMKENPKKSVFLITLGICAATLLGFMLISGITSNLTQTINTRWSIPLTAGLNEISVTLPASGYMIMITEERNLRPGVYGQKRTQAQVSYSIMDSEDRIIFGPSSDTLSSFLIGRDLQYKPLRIQIEMESDEGHPAFFSFGGAKWRA
jgi:hypothetical protein